MAAQKIDFFRRGVYPVATSNSSGNAWRTDYVDSFDECGIHIVKENGKTNFQEFIQSFFGDVDLYTILSRILPDVHNRDLSTVTVAELLKTYYADFTSSEGFYGDITTLPKDIHSVNKNYTAMCEFFDSLPSEVRLKYHNSVDEFVAGFDGFVADVNSVRAELSKNLDSENNVKVGENNE